MASSPVVSFQDRHTRGNSDDDKRAQSNRCRSGGTGHGTSVTGNMTTHTRIVLPAPYPVDPPIVL